MYKHTNTCEACGMPAEDEHDVLCNKCIGKYRPYVLTHCNDPDGSERDSWPFVYLHGMLERINAAQAKREGWEEYAADIFGCNKSCPTAYGEYKATMYGFDVVIVLAEHHGRLGGRAAIVHDVDALAHCRTPEKWG